MSWLGIIAAVITVGVVALMVTVEAPVRQMSFREQMDALGRVVESVRRTR